MCIALFLMFFYNEIVIVIACFSRTYDYEKAFVPR